MRYPEFLRKDGAIGFVAPSFGCNIEPYRTTFAHAQKVFEEKGYSCKTGPNCYEGRGIGISNTPKACGDEINAWYCSNETDILISCGGGELMCEDLEYIDFNRLRAAKPKWYMGYSDNTNLTFLLPTLCDTAAIYGPCAPAFGMEPWHPAIADAWSLLKGEKLSFTGYPLWEKESQKSEANPLAPYYVTEPRKLKAYLPDGKGGMKEADDRKVEIEGRLLGGCMDCLVTLLGTTFDQVKEFDERYREEGIIWFLESCDLNVFGIRRAIWQMKHAGWFGHVKGFLIGRPYCFGQDMMGLDQYHAVTDLLSSLEVPVICDVDLGHLPPMMPVICGSYANVNVQDGELCVNMTCR
ncbi:MAG: LD-carboxypeptidase [Lachnospiraceae bacterium]|nr:LD-carboxypeptidase [Lachnospiraceae bacterium]